MPAKDFYFIIVLSVVIGLLVIKIVVANIGQRRWTRRLEREVAEYLRKRAAVQNN